jgi:hypothetical protein
LAQCSTIGILSDARRKEDTNEGVCYKEYLLLLNGAQQLCHTDNLPQSQYAMPAVVLSLVLKDTPSMNALPCSVQHCFY